MDEIREKKRKIRDDMARLIQEMPEDEIAEKTRQIQERLFEFANFMESRIPLLYVNQGPEVSTERIIPHCFKVNKILVLPTFNKEKLTMVPYKVDDMAMDLATGARGVLEPNPKKCKKVPIKNIDIAIIPGYAFDEKGGRIGSGQGYYDRLIPRLAITTRKVALTFDDVIVPQIPMESHDKFVDIIITDKRIIYKI